MAIKVTKGEGSALDLSKVKGLDLSKPVEAAGRALEKRGLAGIRAEVEFYLDFSGSMRYHYQSSETTTGGGLFRSGTTTTTPALVQTLVDRALSLALQVDPDGKIPVKKYHTDMAGGEVVELSNYSGVVDKLARGSMGGTNFAPPLREVLETAKTTESPLFVFFVTDGVPADKTETIDLICELSEYPVFIKFMAVDESGWDFLDKLNNLEKVAPKKKRKLDNVNSVKAYKSRDSKAVQDMTDDEFLDIIVEEWDEWFAAATAAGILS